MNLSAKEIQKATNGEMLVMPNNNSCLVKSIKINSREVAKDDAFVAICGMQTDGHKFISDAIKNGASLIICEKNLDECNIELAKKHSSCAIKVNSSVQAITDIAKYWRVLINAKVIAITGSVGKTSTKNLVKEVLMCKYKTSANKGNLNNELGLPISLCNSNCDDDFVVSEMGMSNAGEIDSLCKIAKPHWGLITNIGEAHIQNLGSRQNIAKAKSELALSIPDDSGKMFLRADDDYRDFIIDYAKLKQRNVEIILFGACKLFDDIKCPQVWYDNVKTDENGKPSFEIHIYGFDNVCDQTVSCHINIPGKTSAINSCAALAVGIKAQIEVNKIIEVFKSINTESGRFEKLKSKYGFSIINDAYNANAVSMCSSIETFSSMACKGKKIAFLGDMFELGEYSEDAHKKVGCCVAENSIDLLICVGKDSSFIGQQAIKCGLNKNNVLQYKHTKEAVDKLLELSDFNDIVLFKASNGMGFQKIVSQLQI